MNDCLIAQNLCFAITVVKENFYRGDNNARIDISLAIKIPQEIYTIVGLDIFKRVTESKYPYVKLITPPINNQADYVWVYDGSHPNGVALDITSTDFKDTLIQRLQI